MKLKQPFFILIAATAIIFFSCKKDSTPNNNTIDPPVTTDSNYLSKIYIIDSTNAPEDTIETTSYYYDADKRVINVNDSFIHSGVAIPFVAITYYYNGSDTLPYKSYGITVDGSYHDTITRFFSYDTNGRRLKDSITRSTNTGVSFYMRQTMSTYQYVPGKIYGYSRDTMIYSTASITPAEITLDTATLDGNNYIISNSKHRQTTSVQSQITNTSSPNIYQRVNIRGCFDVFPDGHATYGNFGTSNNPSHMIETWSASNVFESNTTYELNNNGYVKKAGVAYTSPSVNYYKTVLIYQSL